MRCILKNEGVNVMRSWICFKIPQALAAVIQWVECQPMNRKVAGSISCEGTCLGCGAHDRYPVGGL